MNALASALGKSVDIKALAGKLANRSDSELADLAKSVGIKDPAGLASQFSGPPKDDDEESLVNTLKKAMPSLAPSTSAAPEGAAPEVVPVTVEQADVVIKLTTAGFTPEKALDLAIGRPTKGGKRRKTFRKRKHAKKTKKGNHV
jgi:hypothetical protein